MSYRKNIVSNFKTQIMVSVLAFMTSIIIARSLGPENKGYVGYIILIFTLIGEYGNLGVLKASIFFQKRSNYDEEYVFINNQTFLLLNFIFISLIIIILKVTGKFFINYNAFHIICGLIIIFFTFSNLNMNNFYIGNERIRESNKFNIIMSLFKSISYFILWIIGRLDVNTYLFVFAFSMVILAIFLYRNLNITMKFHIDMKLIKKQISFGFAIYLSTLFIYMNYRMDQFFIKNMLGERAMGIYSVSVSLAELLFLIPGSVGTAILGRLYNIDSAQSTERKEVTAKTVKYTFYICLILGLIGMAMTPLIPFVYGQEYADASLPTLILFIGIIFASIGKVSSSYFQSIGNTRNHLLITTTIFTVNLILNYILIPKMGIVGAAVASSVSYSVYGLLYVITFIKVEKFKLEDFFKLRKR
ncbi:polysaccharide biosynthesis C-terminal domain-containing protein [Oceanirhabdus seepicola]|uniref:Polysaccharide biosynthesis C-terminal domain-containing protein n=1 Tax=Oceanirhabdus seepicola TaxID=2828781 RepID=A0A9J6P9I7_9CLOT|nr:polysaccharide biosynthesis C-terminal domain-containing protein [Oceanirhabdus seepicola]MCM1992497.1 polysaccharide biosynthesis C-terminal domain-containing protein [Oceanirhabdus seepicola]